MKKSQTVSYKSKYKTLVVKEYLEKIKKININYRTCLLMTQSF